MLRVLPPLISADSHVTEPPGCYIDRIEKAYRDTAPRIVREADGGDSFVVDGMPGSIPLGIVAAAGKDPREIKRGETPFEALHRGGWDPKARVADMDKDGIAGELIYPSVGMVLCNHPDADYKQACMWAYNHWLAEEFVAGAPDRLFGLGQTAVRSVAEAIEDFRKIKEMGFVGVMMPGNPATEFDYDDPRFDPLWRAAVELELPISFHILTTKADGPNAIGSSGARMSRGPAQNMAQSLIRSIQDLIGIFIWGRIFERHPGLRLVCVEADAGWLPHYAQRMDRFFREAKYFAETGVLSKQPSAYIFDNLYITFQDDEIAFRYADSMNWRRLMWANDFPHPDASWPNSRALLARQAPLVTDEQRRAMLCGNVAELYGFDLAKLPAA